MAHMHKGQLNAAAEASCKAPFNILQIHCTFSKGTIESFTWWMSCGGWIWWLSWIISPSNAISALSWDGHMHRLISPARAQSQRGVLPSVSWTQASTYAHTHTQNIMRTLTHKEVKTRAHTAYTLWHLSSCCALRTWSNILQPSTPLSIQLLSLSLSFYLCHKPFAATS